jgi:hypothetical protein
MKKLAVIAMFVLSTAAYCRCQIVEGLLTQAIILQGDTVPIFVLQDVRIYSPVLLQTKHEAMKYSRLVRNVKKVYPYARITGVKVAEMNTIVENAPTEKERKALMKEYEKTLKAQFEEEIKGLTFSQGILLIKLIDRETGQSSYDLIKEFRGTILASFYQTIGVLFGYNLKTTYDPEGEDKEIEMIVRLIENGAL